MSRLLVLDGTLHGRTASRSFYAVFGVSRKARKDTEGQFICDLGIGQWNIPALRILLEGVMKVGKEFRGFEVTHDLPQMGRRVLLMNARTLWTKEDDSVLVLLAIREAGSGPSIPSGPESLV